MAHSTTPPLGMSRLLTVAVICAFCIMLPLALVRRPSVKEPDIPEIRLRNDITWLPPNLEFRGDTTTSPTPTMKHRGLLSEYLPAELERRGLLGPGGILPGKVLPSVLSMLNPDVVIALTSMAAVPLPTIVPAIPNIPSLLPTIAADGGAGIPILPDLGGVVLDPSGIATVAEDASDWIAAGISGLLRGATSLLPTNLPLATVVNDVVSQANKAADQVLSHVQSVAAEVATLAAQVESDTLSPDGAIANAGSLLDNLEGTINNVVNDVVGEVADVVPGDLLDNVKSLVTGGLNSILAATDGPVAMVASIIDQSLCEAVKIVDGLLMTVTGVCGDMASVTSFSPTYTDSATITNTGTAPFIPMITGSNPATTSAPQSITVFPLATGSSAGQTTQLSNISAQGSVFGGAIPTRSENGASKTDAEQNTASAAISGVGNDGANLTNNSGGLKTSPSDGSGASQAALGSGSNGGNNASQKAPGAGSSTNENGQSTPTAGDGASQTAPGLESRPGNGQSGPSGGTSASQTAPVGSGSGASTTPNLGGLTPGNGATPIVPAGGNGGITGTSMTATGEPIPFPPEGTGPNGSWTGGGNMPSQTDGPNSGTNNSSAQNSAGIPGSSSVSAVTVSVMITSTITIGNGVGYPQTIFLPGSTMTVLTSVSIYMPCPAQSLCPFLPPSPGSTQGSEPDRGPCPGSGYTCDACIDGWFCPPPQTPAQFGTNGCFGWPCAHCSSGWFCIPRQSAGTRTSIEASRQAPNSGSSLSPVSPIPVSITTISIPTTEQSPGSAVVPRPANALPTIMNPANGWSYSGCWSDQPHFPVLDFTPETSFGPVENEKCVRHCIVNGYTIAATSFGNKCFCGMFLNGTQKLNDSACMTACIGDSSQACGADWALLIYTPDGIPRGWAPIGEQPNPNPHPAPTIVELAYGGVERSVVTQDIVVGPTSGANLASMISFHGEKSTQPQPSLPSGVGPQTQCTTSPSGPNGASMTAPSRGSTSPVNGGPSPGSFGGINPNTPLSSLGATPSSVVPSGLGTIPGGIGPLNQGNAPSGTAISNPSGNGGSPSTPGLTNAPSSPTGIGGVAPGQQTPIIPAGGGPSPSLPSGQVPSTPSGNGPFPTAPGAGSPSTTPGGIGSSNPGSAGGTPSNTAPNNGVVPTSSGGVAPSPSPPHGSTSPTLPGDNGSGSSPTIGQLPTCAPGSSGINCIPVLPPNAGISPSPPALSPVPTLGTPDGLASSLTSTEQLPTCSPGSSDANCVPALPPNTVISPTSPGLSNSPPSGVPGRQTPSQPFVQGTISLPGVATPKSPAESASQSNSKQASLTAPGRQSSSSSTLSTSTASSRSNGSSSSPGTRTGPTSPGDSPNVPVSLVPGGQGGINPNAPSQGTDRSSLLSTPTVNPASPGGIGPSTLPTLTTGPGGNNPTVPGLPNPGLSSTPITPSGIKPDGPSQGINSGFSPSTPTSNPTNPGGNGSGTPSTPTAGPDAGGGVTPGLNLPGSTPNNGGSLSSYSWPPGLVPYGDHPPFTTLAHMFNWDAPDGSMEAAALEKRRVPKAVDSMEYNDAVEQPITVVRNSRRKWRRRHDIL